MISLQEVAQSLDITKQAVAVSLKKALAKVWKNLGVLYPEISPFEKMLIMGEFCNITTADDWPHFFYGMPVEIRKEVLEETKSENKTASQSRNIDKSALTKMLKNKK